MTLLEHACEPRVQARELIGQCGLMRGAIRIRHPGESGEQTAVSTHTVIIEVIIKVCSPAVERSRRPPPPLGLGLRPAGCRLAARVSAATRLEAACLGPLSSVVCAVLWRDSDCRYQIGWRWGALCGHSPLGPFRTNTSIPPRYESRAQA